MKINTCLVRLFSIFLYSSYPLSLIAQEGPFTGQAIVDLGANQNAELRSTVNVPLNVDISSVTGVDRGGSSTQALLTRAVLAVGYDASKVEPVLSNGEIGAGIASGFSSPHLANVHTDVGSTVLYTLLENATSASLPDNVNLANVSFKLIGDSAETLSFSIAAIDLRTLLDLDSGGGPSIFGGGEIPFTASNMTLSALLPTVGDDADGDGIDDLWEVEHSIDDPNADADGDLLSNYEEFQQGANPNNAKPLVEILSPTETIGFSDTDILTFAATANDNEDGDLSGSILWVSDRDGALGSGSSINQQLSAGRHVVTATVTDSNSEPTTVTLFVVVGGRGMCPVGS